ncbi:MAG: Mu-like prophage major head subunit gpT family protein [Desulfomicrobium sp.]|nr:Mu-like prophage major head subunit gpT family protein [Pseudomonadota bacterium]MBV1710758.1 Mu-like prophage major head subunit gpT family protein [Desulfomicrobium sp.]MBU4570366.1 Mu-like prophage major head subunit gpT family protein [Pseudomonadota bacterium]MBU4593287.1 Mu-like prophage major head subunit gpT family protein [Pseudomonadota bacterium]MBV1719840.1 Mu-like prophage major head subunit gpT family protein [Desulfomicrobium sp.]
MPRKNRAQGPAESKQDFLKRCAAEAAGAGADEAGAMSGCVARWNRERLSALIDEDRFTLSASVELASQDEDESGPRRFGILAYTGKLIDWGYWGRFIIDLAGMRLAKAKVPALLNHDRRQIVGTIDRASADANGFHVTGAFSSVTDAAKEVLGLADENFPWQASIGVQALKIVQLARDATMEVNGQLVTGPCDVWTESSVFETSFCPFGADDDTAAISMTADNNAPKGPEVRMNEKLRKLLERLGLDPSAGEQEALAFMAGIDPDRITSAPGTPALAVPDAAALSGVDVVTLMERGTKLGVAEDKVKELALSCGSLADATCRLVDLAAAANPPVGGGRMESGRTELEKFTLAAEDALCLRSSLGLEKPAPGAAELRGRTLRELAREYLERAGVSTRMMNNQQLAGAALGVVRLTGMHTFSDFGAIMSNVAQKVMQKAYAEAPSTWQAWCSVSEATDFKVSERPQMSEAPSLELINEHGEYTAGSFTDFKESNQLRTYGRKFTVTRKTIINDDLSTLLRIPRAFGSAGARRINDLVYFILTGNQVMAYDARALFHSSHTNLAALALGSDGLSKGREGMRTQTGPGGAVLNIVPRYLLVPAALETAADVLMRSVASTDADKNAGVHNPWQNSLVPVVESRLDANSKTAWYLIADSAQIDTVEVMFLDGVQEPVIEEVEIPDVDGRAYYVRLDVGARALDHRGMRKSAGTGV